ncbi:MAG: AEC family transporter [bacterium]|nr:AEC family transporter [bacterium]
MREVAIIIAPLFLVIFVSAFIQKFKKVGKDWSDVLNSFALNIGLPALIFLALVKSPFNFLEKSDLIVVNSVFLLASFLLVYVLGKVLRFSKKLLRTLFICFTFSNFAYLGLPVLTQVLGEQILPTAGLIIAVYSFWLFTVGLGFLDYSNQGIKKDVFKNVFRDLVRNPLLISVFLGLLVATLDITPPVIIMKSVEMLAVSVTPVVLVVIGLFIGNTEIGKIKEWIPVTAFSAITLLALPAAFYYSVQLIGFSPEHFSASLIEVAMPLAITPFALADKFNLEKKFIARSIVMSTILSALTIPFWISLV